MRVLVTGVTGIVGWGVARAMLQQGHHVIAATRSVERAQDLLDPTFSPGLLSFAEVDFADPDSVTNFKTTICNGPKIDHAVVALGGWWQRGSFAQQTSAEYQSVRSMLLDSQVHAAASIIPSLMHAQDTSYTMITGAGALSYIPSTSLLFIAMGGVRALSEVLRTEHSNGPVRVNEIMIGVRLERDKKPGTFQAEDFGKALIPYLSTKARSAVLGFDGAQLRGRVM